MGKASGISSDSLVAPARSALGALDRKPARVAGFVVSASGLAVLVALSSALVLTLVFAFAAANGELIHLPAAIATLTDSARPGRSLISYAFELSVAGVCTYLAALAVLALARRIFKRPIRTFLTSAPRFRWGVVLAGFVLGLPMVALGFLGERLGDTSPLSPPILTADAGLQVLGYAGIAAVCLYLAAFAEEAIFRGWLLQQTAAWTRNLPIILGVNGVLFSLVHFDPVLSNFLVRAIMGAGWAWIALRTGGVEFTTGAHLANNLFVALFVAPVKFVAPAPEAEGWVPALIETAVLLAIAGAVEIYVRRGGLLPSAKAQAQVS
jgi:membrane protease YdiL (CAAX protease family)